MITIICSIFVTYINADGIGFMSKAQLEGRVLKENNFNYLVDFSKKAKEEGYSGDYSKLLVKKEDCI